jgi:outer membrane receptor protein involved in Fe transport
VQARTQSLRLERITLLLAVAATVATPAWADADDPIDEIQVTATRRPLATNRVSAAVTVVPADEINAQKLATDALASELGVFLQQTTVGQGAAIIRGLKGSEILHIVDGLRLNNAIFRNAPTQYLSLVAPGSIERMEVVRGSPTSLYGSDAVGGVIQVISRLPRFDGDALEMRRELFVAADSAELGKSARASFDIGNRELAGLASVSYQDSGNRRTGSGARVAPSGFESWSARGALHYRPADDRSWVLDLQVVRQPSTPRVDELVPGFGQTEPSSSEYFFEPNERRFVHVRHTRNDGLWNADWTIDLGWQHIDDDRRTRDLNASNRRFEENSSDLYGLSFSGAREFGDSSWVFGGEVYHDTVHSSRYERDINTGDATTLQARFPDGSSVDQRALFANVSQPVSERHSLSGGLRLSGVDIDLPATTISPAASISIDDVSADIGWLFDATDELQFVANVGYGFRAPNIFDLGTLGERPGNRFNIPNPGLSSERVLQYDLAVRKRAELWTAEFVIYQINYRDRIQSVLTGDTTAGGREIVQSRNLGRAEIHGAEAGLRWHPAGAWSGEILLNYTRGEQREDNGSYAAGDRIPPLNGRAIVRWELNEDLSARGSVTFADRQGRLSPRDIGDTRIDPAGTAGWAVANVGLSWQMDETWQFDAGVDNLLDRQYRVHGSGIDSVGRNYYLTARAGW